MERFRRCSGICLRLLGAVGGQKTSWRLSRSSPPVWAPHLRRRRPPSKPSSPPQPLRRFGLGKAPRGSRSSWGLSWTASPCWVPVLAWKDACRLGGSRPTGAAPRVDDDPFVAAFPQRDGFPVSSWTENRRSLGVQLGEDRRQVRTDPRGCGGQAPTRGFGGHSPPMDSPPGGPSVASSFLPLSGFFRKRRGSFSRAYASTRTHVGCYQAVSLSVMC